MKTHCNACGLEIPFIPNAVYIDCKGSCGWSHWNHENGFIISTCRFVYCDKQYIIIANSNKYGDDYSVYEAFSKKPYILKRTEYLSKEEAIKLIKLMAFL